MNNIEAPYPHCDQNVLHAPRECEYCDMYPEMQATREMNRINFTGKNDPFKNKCPAEERRGLNVINMWGGNIKK